MCVLIGNELSSSSGVGSCFDPLLVAILLLLVDPPRAADAGQALIKELNFSIADPRALFLQLSNNEAPSRLTHPVCPVVVCWLVSGELFWGHQ